MTDCPALSKITAETVAITQELVAELRVSTYDRSPGTTVNVECQFNLELLGPKTVICGNNGQWSGSPSCLLPGKSTTAAPDSSGLDESTILLIVLIVVVVFVVAVIVVICVALYYGKFRRWREKGKKESSLYGANSLPYTNSVSERYVRDNNNVAMNNFYTRNAQHDFDGYHSNDSDNRTFETRYRSQSDYREDNYNDLKHDDNQGDRNFRYNDNGGYRNSDTDREYYYRHPTVNSKDYNLGRTKYDRSYRSYDDLHGDRNFRYHDPNLDRPTENRVKRDDHQLHTAERRYDRNPKVLRSPAAGRRRYANRYSNVTEMRHAKSADDIYHDRGYNDGYNLRRDNHLWRSMNTIPNQDSWNIPRPYYAN